MVMAGGSGNNRGVILEAVVIWYLWSFSEDLVLRLLPPPLATKTGDLRVILLGLVLHHPTQAPAGLTPGERRCVLGVLDPHGDNTALVVDLPDLDGRHHVPACVEINLARSATVVDVLALGQELEGFVKVARLNRVAWRIRHFGNGITNGCRGIALGLLDSQSDDGNSIIGIIDERFWRLVAKRPCRLRGNGSWQYSRGTLVPCHRCL